MRVDISFYIEEALGQCAAVMPVADSDMVVDNSHGMYEGQTAGHEGALPASLGSPAADKLKNFYHTKRVGNYLIGRKLGEGSFAKVREGLHAMTGEKVITPLGINIIIITWHKN